MRWALLGAVIGAVLASCTPRGPVPELAATCPDRLATDVWREPVTGRLSVRGHPLAPDVTAAAYCEGMRR